MQIKGWTRKKKEALIENNWDKIKELAVCINESSYLNHTQTRTPFDSSQGYKNIITEIKFNPNFVKQTLNGYVCRSERLRSQ